VAAPSFGITWYGGIAMIVNTRPGGLASRRPSPAIMLHASATTDGTTFEHRPAPGPAQITAQA
jgi:hypothetical protein